MERNARREKYRTVDDVDDDDDFEKKTLVKNTILKKNKLDTICRRRTDQFEEERRENTLFSFEYRSMYTLYSWLI